MLAAAAVFGFGAVAALVVTRWLPVRSMDEDHLLEAYGEAAAVELIPLNALVPASRVVDPLPSVPVRDGAAMGGLERIAVLLEEIEHRREREAARRSAPDPTRERQRPRSGRL
jgi:hypothetical protein